MLAFSEQWRDEFKRCAEAGGDGQRCERARREKWGCADQQLLERPYQIGPVQCRRCPSLTIAENAEAVAQARAVAMLGDELRWACPDPTLRTVECWQAIQVSRSWDWDDKREKTEQQRRAAERRRRG